MIFVRVWYCLRQGRWVFFGEAGYSVCLSDFKQDCAKTSQKSRFY